MSFWTMLTLRSWRMSTGKVSWLVRKACCVKMRQHTDDGLLRDKHPTELLGEAAPVLLAVAHGDAHGETTGIHNVSNGALEAVDVLVPDGQAPDLDLAAHAVDADDEGHGGLLVGVDEAQGPEARVPSRREPGGEGLALGWTLCVREFSLVYGWRERERRRPT